jgi:hypothetical protein
LSISIFIGVNGKKKTYHVKIHTSSSVREYLDLLKLYNAVIHHVQFKRGNYLPDLAACHYKLHVKS